MRCKNCKAKLPKGAAFCPVCRTPVTKRRKWPFVLVGVLVFVAILAAVGVGLWFAISDEGSDTRRDDGSAEVSASDDASSSDGEDSDDEIYVDEYEYQNVIEEIAASSSDDVTSASETISELDARGFSDIELEATYDMNGELLDDTTLDEDDDDTYPLYSFMYTTAEGNLWVVYVVNGSVMADPIFAYEYFVDVPILLIEDEYVTSYDADQDLYIVTSPADDELIVKQVDQVTAELLESLTAEEIDTL